MYFITDYNTEPNCWISSHRQKRQIQFIFKYLEKEYVATVLSDAIETLEIRNKLFNHMLPTTISVYMCVCILLLVVYYV